MCLTDYEWLTQHNLCHRCRKERPAPNRKYCFNCLDKIREENALRYDPLKAKEYQEQRRKIYSQKKERGICVRCSKKATHGLYCYEHAIYVKRHNAKTAERRKRERRERGLIPEYRKEQKLCLRCGKSAMPNSKYCEDCFLNLCDALNKGRPKSPFREMERVRYLRRKL